MQWVLGTTVEYAKTREQFGRVIGSFQALGHRAAELFTQLELARSCVMAAARAHVCPSALVEMEIAAT